MSITLAPLPLPVIGTDAHSVSTLQPLLNAINANLITLKNAIEGVETTVSASKVEYLQDTVPAQANVGDKWFKTDNPVLASVTRIEGFVNIVAYAVVDGLTTPQKEARWKPQTDEITEQTIIDLQTLVDGKVTTSQGDNPPAAFNFGDIWIQTEAGKQNQVHTCKDAYDFSGSGGTPHGASPVAWSSIEISTYFRPSGDPEALGIANLAQGVADGKRASYLRDDMPGVDLGDALLIFEAGDEWADTDDPAFSTYYCFQGYNGSDAFLPDLATFQAAHWRLKGDPTARQDALVAHGLADGKTTTFDQLTPPTEAKTLDVWFKNFEAPDDDKDELYVNDEGDYDEAFIQAGFLGAGYPTAEAYRLSFWRLITDPNALAAANQAAILAGEKSTNFFSDAPPNVAIAGDTWTETDGIPIRSYICTAGYDYSAQVAPPPVWNVNGPHAPPTDPQISEHWENQANPLFEDQAASSRAIVDGKRMTFTGESPPQNSGVTDPTTGLFIDVDVGDLFARVTEDLSDSSPDSFTIYVCYRSYTDIPGLGFVGTDADRDVNGDLLLPADIGFDEQNAHNYWKQTRDKGAIEFALDIQALKDGKRTVYVSDSREARIQHGHSAGIPDLSKDAKGIQLGDIWVDVGSVDPVVAQTQIDLTNPDYGLDPALGYFRDLPSGQRIHQFQVYKCRDAYAYDEADGGDRFQGIIPNPDPLEGEWYNWLAVDEPELRLQVMRKSAFDNDGVRSIFVTYGVVPNVSVGLPNWEAAIGAKLGDIWIDISVFPAKPLRYVCILAYTVGGTLANWKREDSVTTDPGDPDSPASVQHVAAVAILRDGTNSPTASIDWGNVKITNMLGGSVAPGSLEAVNGGQLNTVLDAAAAAQTNIDSHEADGSIHSVWVADRSSGAVALNNTNIAMVFSAATITNMKNFRGSAFFRLAITGGFAGKDRIAGVINFHGHPTGGGNFGLQIHGLALSGRTTYAVPDGGFDPDSLVIANGGPVTTLNLVLTSGTTPQTITITLSITGGTTINVLVNGSPDAYSSFDASTEVTIA